MTINREIQRTSYRQFETFTAQHENQDRRFELINGEIVEKMPTEEHSIVTTNIYDPLKAFVKLRDLGRVLFEVRRKMPSDDHNAFLPDLEFTGKDRLLPVVRKGAVPQMPDLAIEIKSPDDSTLDPREKAIYSLKHGSRMVWWIFPAKKQVEVHTADSIVLYQIGDSLDGGDVLAAGIHTAHCGYFRRLIIRRVSRRARAAPDIRGSAGVQIRRWRPRRSTPPAAPA